MVEIYLDPGEARAYAERRARRINLATIPAARLAALNGVAVAILLHNLVVFGSVAWEPWLVYVLAVEAYCLLSWAILRRLYRREREWLALTFLVLDFVPMVAGVYLTGGTESWIFFFLLFRVVDQTGASFRRVLLFAQITPVAYLSMVLWIAFVEGRPVAWDLELLKTVLLFFGSLYASWAARASERQREYTAEAVRVARGLIRDLEDHRAKLLEQSLELQDARARAEQASEARAELLARASHELRTPLNHILGFGQLLETSTLSDEQRSNLSEVLRAGRSLLEMVDEMLQITDLQTGQDGVELQAVPLREVLREVLAAAAPEAARRRVRLPTSLPDACDRMVRADPRRITQVFEELVKNAIIYNSDQGWIEITCSPAAGERVRICIKDSGMGLPAERLADVFLPFERLGAERVSSLKGAGLGLAVVKALVTRMEGEIGAESEPQKGSTFWVELPLAFEDYTPAEPWT